MDPQRRLLQHFLAALAYRTQKALRGAPDVNGREMKDWITDCAAQFVVYQELTAALDALTNN